MVDGELWSRFFKCDKYWHLNAVVGGFRKHSGDRGKINEVEVDLEMKKICENLKNKENRENLIKLMKVMEIAEKRRKLVRHKVFKLLPYFMFKKYILIYKIEDVNCFNHTNNFAKYYIIQFINGQWEKRIEPYF